MLDTPNRQALLFSLALIRRDTEKTSPRKSILDIPRTLVAWILLASLLRFGPFDEPILAFTGSW